MLGKKVYLGEHVYAKFTGDGIEFTSNDGAENRNRIFLDQHGINQFNKFQGLILKWLAEMAEKQKSQNTK